MTTNRRPHFTAVATGVIRKGDEVLVGRRPQGQSLAGQWEFPGGKIEVNESPEAALKRELSEELGIEAEIGDLMLAQTHYYGESGLIILIFDVHFWQGEPKTKHHDSLRWVKIDDLPGIDMPEANKHILSRLLKMLSKRTI